jgi:hypothetical protein
MHPTEARPDEARPSARAAAAAGADLDLPRAPLVLDARLAVAQRVGEVAGVGVPQVDRVTKMGRL